MPEIKSSELILNPDGSIFHLHLKPGDISKDIILVGDPARVDLISGYFDSVEFKVSNREFTTVTGEYMNKRLSVVSTGIGTDNIDIVINELDALVNIDLKGKTIKRKHTSLNFIRIGTSGALQPDIPINSFVASKKAIGFDGLLNFYSGRVDISDLEFEKAFTKHTLWSKLISSPYVVDADNTLFNKIAGENIISGVTISAPGFYGPQGRELRIPVADPELNNKIASFRFSDMRITNYEMECSGIYGLSKLLGHQALTVCAIIANRATGEANENYYQVINKLVKIVLDRIVLE